MKSQINKYKNNGFKEIYNENLIYNYQFYYSNKYIDNKAIVSLLFSQKNPTYITISNFILDIEAYKDILGDLPSINEENKKEINLGNAFQDIILGIISENINVVQNLVNIFSIFVK